MVYRKNKKASAYETPETRRKKQLANLFTMQLTGIGEVPMMFYIPDLKAKEKLQEQIEQNGGIIVDQYEAYVYQIKPTKGLKNGHASNREQFYVGYVYNSQWITDSIKKGRLLDQEDYLCGFNKTTHLKSILKQKKNQYTISEVLKIFELVEEDGGNARNVPSMKFWNEIFAKNYIPDRSAASLRTAYKKFSVTTKKQFIKAALKKASTRFSHQFGEVPETKISKTTSSKDSSWTKNLSSVFNSASTKPNEELSPPLPMVDLNVQTNEPSIITGGEEVEFVLEVEDMQSVISNNVTGDSSYNMRPNRKRRHKLTLDEMYNNYACSSGYKRIKIQEANPKIMDFNESDTTIYEQEGLFEYISSDAKVKITHDSNKNERIFKSKISNNESFFVKITEDLQELWDKYDMAMEEIHSLFMSVWWDMEELRKVLIEGKQIQEWQAIEDFAVASEPGSAEFEYLKKEKGE